MASRFEIESHLVHVWCYAWVCVLLCHVVICHRHQVLARAPTILANLGWGSVRIPSEPTLDTMGRATEN